MTIQIIGLRKQNNGNLVQRFFSRGWGDSSVASLFENIDEHIALIPEEERYNLFYTVNNCVHSRARSFASGCIYPFDIDGMDVSRIMDYIDPICDELNVSRDHVGIISSGHGLHILVESKISWDDPDFFKHNRPAYKQVCDKINRRLESENLPGKADPAVFDRGRILRLPCTENRKENKDPVKCTVIKGDITPVDYCLSHSLGMAILNPRDHISKKAFQLYSKPDTGAVLNGCEFLKWCKDNQSEVGEPQWYAMLSILSYLENGRELAHEYSREHGDYETESTDNKFDQAHASSGPRTCANIDSLSDKCKSCPYYDDPEVISPIKIKGDDFIASKETGFRSIKPDGKPGDIVYPDLVKHYNNQSPYVSIANNGMIYIYDGKFWKEDPENKIKNFVHDNVRPFAFEKQRVEFIKALRCTNLKDHQWFTDSTTRLINLNNGVLNIDTMELIDHSPKYGFRYCLPYDYDASAICPTFDNFMKDITCNDETMQEMLLQYAGYCFSGDKCLAQKAMVLLGDGSNGKSTFINVLKKLAGEENYSSLTMDDLKNDQHRNELVGRLFNVAEETPNKSMVDSSIFKNLVTGGDVMVKVVYLPPVKYKNTTKMLFAANKMPVTSDMSTGMFRRLLIVPFDANFTESNADVFIEDKLYRELPGILNRVIQGYKKLSDNNYRFPINTRVSNEIKQYEKSTNPILVWLEECCNLVTESDPETNELPRLSIEEAFISYVNFCERSKIRYIETKLSFSRIIGQNKSLDTKRFRVNGKLKRFIIGIVLADDRIDF